MELPVISLLGLYVQNYAAERKARAVANQCNIWQFLITENRQIQLQGAVQKGYKSTFAA